MKHSRFIVGDQENSSFARPRRPAGAAQNLTPMPRCEFPADVLISCIAIRETVTQSSGLLRGACHRAALGADPLATSTLCRRIGASQARCHPSLRELAREPAETRHGPSPRSQVSKPREYEPAPSCRRNFGILCPVLGARKSQ